MKGGRGEGRGGSEVSREREEERGREECEWEEGGVHHQHTDW